MGSDRGPEALAAGVRAFLDATAEASALLVGPAETLAGLRDGLSPPLRARTRAVAATEVVAMSDTARDALRAKGDSSMRRTLELVRDGEAAACVSAGNTAALMALSRKILQPLEAIRRPAIVSAIPAIGGHTFMLDLGANSDCTAGQLYEFAVMGECVARQAAGVERPRVGLLNIGQEETKGTPTVREAADRLRATDMDFVGFVEGHDIFLGGVDVVVSDGFAGNVALKTMEGLAALVRHYLVEAGADDGAPGDRIARAAALLDPRRRNGATLVGLDHVVVKSHGSADDVAFAHALHTAWAESRGDVPAAIARRFAELAPTQTR